MTTTAEIIFINMNLYSSSSSNRISAVIEPASRPPWHFTLQQGCGVLIFYGTPTPTPLFKKLRLRLHPLKIPRLRLRVKVRHRLLNLCDCDRVLSEWCRQTSSQDSKNNNPILLQSYLNFISVIACSETVHNVTQTKFKLLVYVQSSCTKIIRHCNKYIIIPKAVLFFGKTPTPWF